MFRGILLFRKCPLGCLFWHGCSQWHKWRRLHQISPGDYLLQYYNCTIRLRILLIVVHVPTLLSCIRHGVASYEKPFMPLLFRMYYCIIPQSLSTLVFRGCDQMLYGKSQFYKYYILCCVYIVKSMPLRLQAIHILISYLILSQKKQIHLLPAEQKLLVLTYVLTAHAPPLRHGLFVVLLPFQIQTTHHQDRLGEDDSRHAIRCTQSDFLISDFFIFQLCLTVSTRHGRRPRNNSVFQKPSIKRVSAKCF